MFVLLHLFLGFGCKSLKEYPILQIFSMKKQSKNNLCHHREQ